MYSLTCNEINKQWNMMTANKTTEILHALLQQKIPQKSENHVKK
jgi:hypothetical protein